MHEPVIYFTAAMFQRRRGGEPLKAISLDEHHAVEVLGLAAPLLYVGVIAWKGSLTVYDGAVLILLYTAYLLILSRRRIRKTVEDLEAIPRKIVTSSRITRTGPGAFFKNLDRSYQTLATSGEACLPASGPGLYT